jgi:hypothetical protein
VSRRRDLLLSQYVVTWERHHPAGLAELRVGVRRDGVKVMAPGWID